MARKDGDTRNRIVAAAARLVRDGGPSALTFDAVAEKLGVSKQAVIYWFGTKADLIEAVSLPGLMAEAETAAAAVAGTGSPREAIRDFVGSVADFHLKDLDRFRLMYVAPQTGRKNRDGAFAPPTTHRIHAVTSQLYAALEEKLVLDSGPGGERDQRQRAVVIHTAVLGLVFMISLADAIGDPLRHDTQDLVDTLTEMLSRG